MTNAELYFLRLERILAINQALVASHPLDEILHQVVNVATELVDCETVGILLFDETENSLRFVASTLHKDRLFSFPVPINASLAGAAFSSGQPVIVQDAPSDPRFNPKISELIDMPTRSILAVPLEFQNVKIGVLEAKNKFEPQQFDENDARVLTLLASQAAIAIENATQVERYKQLAQSEQDQHKITDALRLASAAISSTLDYDQVIDRILEQVGLVIPNDTSNIMMIEENDIARVFRGQGYEQYGTADTLNDTILDMKTVIGLQRMCETHQPVVIPNVQQDPTWVYSRPEHYWIRSYVGAPIIIREQVVGFLNVNSAIPNLYNEKYRERLQAFANHAATALENARLYRQAQEEIAERIKIEDELRRHRDHLEELIKERTAEIHRLAITDPLTELHNRRHLMDLGKKALCHSVRHRRAFSVMMLDIDHFKKINDTYGHAVGDIALRAFSNQLRQNLRAADLLGRYGGEEFVVMMPETDMQAALQMADRLINGIRNLRIPTGKDEFGFTTSIGVASWQPGENLEALISRADEAMYAAKQSGRDRVISL